ncbi:hypothetical protein RclHR1_10920005 [Rhizophagus clarus]|uniref:Ribonuclease H-like domain-containing protein n=1 Tax=Rhizophagus clarus TaxID=94130 RepID=A0A2Z6Q2W9_9GLOM|nr:hypothetical protein RclHR1_10920005 [Rhizophagus clarus]GES98305.1 ribonuclease H-like domain-containing protein [Rhizophagus clarus]
MIDRLEKRWKMWEQPLHLLSYLLHPKYRMEQFNNSVSNINYLEFGKWLMYYYCAWSGKEPKCILSEFNDFRLAQYPFDLNTYRQFNNDIWLIIFNPLITESTIDDLNVDQDPGNLDSIYNPADNLPTEENNSEESDDEANEAGEPENKFGEYLQGWVEEKNAESNEDSDEDNDSTDNNTANIHDVTHPAIDVNAKWELKTLFKDNINLPF